MTLTSNAVRNPAVPTYGDAYVMQLMGLGRKSRLFPAPAILKAHMVARAPPRLGEITKPNTGGNRTMPGRENDEKEKKQKNHSIRVRQTGRNPVRTGTRVRAHTLFAAAVLIQPHPRRRTCAR